MEKFALGVAVLLAMTLWTRGQSSIEESETKHVVTVEKFNLCCVLKGIGEKIEVGFFDYHEQNLNSL